MSDVDNIIGNLRNKKSRNSESDIYGEDYYSNPFTNTEYEKTLHDLNVDKFIYDLAAKDGQAKSGKSMVATGKSPPFIYDGHTVIRDYILIQNLSIDSLQGMQSPQYLPEPGYLISFHFATNDPQMSLKVYAKGHGETGFSIADYSMQKMAMLGLGMTQGEAEEIVYTTEGQTSRDISGKPSDENPYLVRYKHLPTGTETDYNVYKGTSDDAWIVASYAPKIPPKFTTLFFDVFNGNSTGARLVHYLEIKRLIIETNKAEDKVPPYSESILSLPLGGGGGISNNTGELLPLPAAAQSNYVRKVSGKLKRKSDMDLLYNSRGNNMYSITKEQQQTPLFKDIMEQNHEIFNELIKSKFQEARRLRRRKT